MNRRISKPPALLLALTLILSLLPTALAAPARSESDPAESNALRATGLLPILPHGGKLPGETDKKDDDTVRGALPAAYDSRDYGYITPVRDQGSYNTCWTFSTAAACEAYMIKHGVEVGDTGVAADQSLNLSEYHLAWYTYTAAYDAEEMLTGDNTAFLSSANTNFLDHGGTGELVSYPLMRWTGLAAETEPALMYSSASYNGLGADYAYQYNVAHVQSAKHFFGENIDEVKRHIMEYGAGAMGVRVSNQSGTAYHGGVNTSNGTICWKQNAVAYQDANFYYADHDVTVVGWDDNYPKENFNNGYRPSQNGAWIIKNSWGTGIGVDGYFYVSYEDSATRASYVSFFTVEGVDNYDHNYQYDGSANYSCWEELSTGDAIAQEFVAGGSETLNAVAIGMCGDDTDYTLKIYTDCTPGDPTAGVLAHSQTGNIDYWGYQTVPLDSPVTLSQGQRFSVVFEFEGSDILPLYDASYSENQYYNMQVTHQPHPNTAYLKRAADSAWTDMSGDRNYRVKAYTRDIPEEPVPMSLSCYALGSLYQTISGTAGDKIHLPSTAPAAEGWSFLGWVAAPLEETVEKPVFYKPGASYKLTASVSAVYALYLRAEPIDAPVTYELVTAVPSTWEGKYVFTCMNTTGSAEYVMYGVAGDANIENTSSAAAFASSGITRNGTTLSDVPERYVFEIAASGGGMSVRSVDKNSWLASVQTGSTSTSYYLYALNEYDAGKCSWTFEKDDDAWYLKNNNSGLVPYVGVSGSTFAMTRYGGEFKYYKQNPTETFYYSTVGGAPEPTEPIEIDTIRIYASLSIGIELDASFSVRSTDLSNYNSWYIEVSKLDADGNVTASKRFGEGQEGAVTGDDVYQARYTDITAKELGVAFTASVHAFDAVGREYVSKNIVNSEPIFTFRDYILGELTKEGNSDSIRTLAADLMNYGAAAQVYFEYDVEHPVNENLSIEAQAALKHYATAGVAPATLVNGTNGPNVYGSLSIKNRIVLTLTIRGIGSPETVQIKIKEHDGEKVKEIIDTEKNGSVWQVQYSGLDAEDMRTLYDFVPVADGEETGTPLTWSVEGYAREARLNEDATSAELDLFNALLHYVDAVDAVDFGS